MKTILLLFIFLLSFSSFSQSPLFGYWDFQLDTVNTTQFSIDSTNQDNFIWQIGESYKPFFGNTNVLVTDTLQMYNGPIDASVNMLITKNNINAGFVVEFDHKMDTDTNHAGGYFEINIDNDSIRYVNSNNDTLSTYWLKLFFNSETDTTELFGFGPYSNYGGSSNTPYLITENNDLIDLTSFVDYNIEPSNLGLSSYYLSYGYTDTLYNNDLGFSGEYNEYKKFYFEFMFVDFITVKTQDQNDSLNFRFHFVSDATSTNKNGWAIKNIKTGYALHPFGTIDEKNISNQISVYPNPTTEKINVLLNTNQKENIIIDVYNLAGQKVETLVKNSNKITIDISSYPKGIYLIKYLIKEKEIGYSKVVKL